MTLPQEKITASDCEQRPEAHATASRAVVRDCAFLALVVAASCVLYVGGLGFYSDDWCHLQLMVNAPDQSLAGMLKSFYSQGWGVYSRPLQVAYLTGLYWLFGLNPVAMHLVNCAVFAGAIVLFYMSLREVGLPRILALVAPLMYALLPHYSAHRFWFAAFQGNLSMLLYFLSLYACVRGVRDAARARAWWWVALLAAVGSTLAYEIAAPFLLVNAALVVVAYRRSSRVLSPRPVAVFLLAYAGSIAAIGVLKALTTVRGPTSGYVHQAAHFDLARNVASTVTTHFGSYGIDLPAKALHVVGEYPSPARLAATTLVAAAIFAYLYRLVRRESAGLPSATVSLAALGSGLGLFALGFAVFVGFSDIPVATTGITNRLAIAAAVGVAFVFVGAIGYACSLVPATFARTLLFCACVSLLCAAGFLVVNTEGAFWVTAYAKEREVLADIRARFPTLPSGTTLLLDGVCPYEGPAIVFDNPWDLCDALRIAYRDPTLRADVVRPGLQVRETMISSWSCGWREDHPYGDRLLVYDYARKEVLSLASSADARAYLAARRSDCPPGSEGYGVSIFGPEPPATPIYRTR
jgi:hypothetical protein